jgi:excisionase family DNA binding protein
MDDAPSGPGGPQSGGGSGLSPRARQLKERLLGEFSLSVDDVAGILEVDRSTVYRYIQDGALAALKLGREYRLSEADVESFLEALVARERQRVAELRVRALTQGGPSGRAALPAAVVAGSGEAPEEEVEHVAEPAPAEPPGGDAIPMGPMAVGLQHAAAGQARRTGHLAVRPAHVLLALISDEDCILWDRPFPERLPLRASMARQALERAGTDLTALRAALEAALPPPDAEPGKGPPDRDMRDVFRAVWGPVAREATASLGRRWVGTDAILLALYGQEELAEALRGAGAEQSRIRAELRRMAATLAAAETDRDRPRWSELARQACRVAAELAWRRGAHAIAPEDLLLVLLQDAEPWQDGLAQRSLAAAGADLAAIRTWAEARLGPAGQRAPDPGAAPLPPDPRLHAAVCERAPAAARGLGHPEVGTEHLLLALYAVPEVARALERAGAPHGEIRAAVRRLAPPGTSPRTEGQPLFGRYSERSQRVILLAKKEARRRGTRFVATGHLLLALLQEGAGIGARALPEAGADVEALRRGVEALLPAPAAPAGGPEGEIPFTPRAKALVMRHALAAARALGHRYVGTEHLLLAAYDADPDLAAVLEGCGAVREGVEAAILRLMQGAEPRGAAPAVPQHPAVASALTLAEKRARRLGHRAVGPEHLLLGLLDLRGGAARRVLERLHADLAALEEQVTAALPRGVGGPSAAAAAGGGRATPAIALSPEGREVLARAAAAAAEAGAPRVGTEHVLLGLHGVPQVAQLLAAAGAPADAVAVEVARGGDGADAAEG